MPTSLWWNRLSDHPLVQWGITRGASQEASLPKGAIKQKNKKTKKLGDFLFYLQPPAGLEQVWAPDPISNCSK